MQQCPRCARETVIFPDGDGHICTACFYKFPKGMTAKDYAEAEAQKLLQQKHEKEQRELRISQRRQKAKEDPEFRAKEYLEFMRKGGLFPHQYRLRDNHIYIIQLKEEVSQKKNGARVFPSKEFKDIFPLGSTGFRGCVYVGITGDTSKEKGRDSMSVCEDRFLKHKKGIHAGKKIVTKYSKTDDFYTCGKPLTERYGMANVVNNYPSENIRNERYESWIGYMLYKIGYHVWGPHAHKEKNRETFGDFLGKDDFI